MSEPHPPTKPSAANLHLVKRGRSKQPTVILPNGIAYLEAAAARGLSQKAAAVLLGISDWTLRQCFDTQPESREAWDRGLAALEDELTSLWLKLARSGNVAATLFGLKCKAGWRETGPTASGDAATTRVVINLPAPMTREQFVLADGALDTREPRVGVGVGSCQGSSAERPGSP